MSSPGSDGGDGSLGGKRKREPRNLAELRRTPYLSFEKVLLTGGGSQKFDGRTFIVDSTTLMRQPGEVLRDILILTQGEVLDVYIQVNDFLTALKCLLPGTFMVPELPLPFLTNAYLLFQIPELEEGETHAPIEYMIGLTYGDKPSFLENIKPEDTPYLIPSFSRFCDLAVMPRKSAFDAYPIVLLDITGFYGLCRAQDFSSVEARSAGDSGAEQSTQPGAHGGGTP